MVSDVSGVSVDSTHRPLVRRAKTVLKKQQRAARERRFLDCAFTAKLASALLERDAASVMFLLLSYTFLLRVPFDAMPAQVGRLGKAGAPLVPGRRSCVGLSGGGIVLQHRGPLRLDDAAVGNGGVTSARRTRTLGPTRYDIEPCRVCQREGRRRLPWEGLERNRLWRRVDGTPNKEFESCLLYLSQPRMQSQRVQTNFAGTSTRAPTRGWAGRRCRGHRR